MYVISPLTSNDVAIPEHRDRIIDPMCSRFLHDLPQRRCGGDPASRCEPSRNQQFWPGSGCHDGATGKEKESNELDRSLVSAETTRRLSSRNRDPMKLLQKEFEVLRMHLYFLRTAPATERHPTLGAKHDNFVPSITQAIDQDTELHVLETVCQ
jgi:hypothetical protein